MGLVVLAQQTANTSKSPEKAPFIGA